MKVLSQATTRNLNSIECPPPRLGGLDVHWESSYYGALFCYGNVLFFEAGGGLPYFDGSVFFASVLRLWGVWRVAESRLLGGPISGANCETGCWSGEPHLLNKFVSYLWTRFHGQIDCAGNDLFLHPPSRGPWACLDMRNSSEERGL